MPDKHKDEERVFRAVKTLRDPEQCAIRLKELWTLKWHPQFNTSGPWTEAGGVQSTDWPEWMR